MTVYGILVLTFARSSVKFIWKQKKTVFPPLPLPVPRSVKYYAGHS